MNEILKNQKGATLMELIVSVAIFAVIMIIATGIFQSISRGQQVAIASQNTQESLRYVFEVMSKEMRFAKTSNTDTTSDCRLVGAVPPSNRIFNQDSQALTNHEFTFDSEYLYFKNKNGECVYYFKRNNALMVYRSKAGVGYLATTTPSNVVVSAFGSYIYDRGVNPLAVRQQPYATFYIKAYAKGHEESKNATVLETTVSSRMYE